MQGMFHGETQIGSPPRVFDFDLNRNLPLYGKFLPVENST